MKLPDFSILDFNGGLVTDKGNFQLNKNEFVNTLNLDFEEQGRAKRRKGIKQFGDTISGSPTIDDSFFWVSSAASPASRHFVVTRAANGDFHRVQGTYNTVAIAVNATTIT